MNRPRAPVLWLSNQRIADLVGCSSRTVQRALRVLHELGVIAIGWGKGNTRLIYRQDGGDEAELVGIDLRPALVFATEMAIRRQARLAALHAFVIARDATHTAILVARGAVAAVATDDAAKTAHRQQLQELRREVQTADRRAHQPTSTVTTIEAAMASVAALGARAEALGQVPEQTPVPPDDGGEQGEDKAAGGDSPLSPRCAETNAQKTESTTVDAHVRTIQGPGRTAAKGWDGTSESDDPAAPMLYSRWLKAYQGTRPLTTDELIELEITARLRARAMGLATRAVNQAVERHGIGLTMGAILFVSALPEAARVRCKAGLLVALGGRALA